MRARATRCEVVRRPSIRARGHAPDAEVVGAVRIARAPKQGPARAPKQGPALPGCSWARAPMRLNRAGSSAAPVAPTKLASRALARARPAARVAAGSTIRARARPSHSRSPAARGWIECRRSAEGATLALAPPSSGRSLRGCCRASSVERIAAQADRARGRPRAWGRTRRHAPDLRAAPGMDPAIRTREHSEARGADARRTRRFRRRGPSHRVRRRPRAAARSGCRASTIAFAVGERAATLAVHRSRVGA
jgi:hypothetical protein